MTKEFFLKKQLKNARVWYIIVSVCFILGIVIGALYCVGAEKGSETALYEYLKQFISAFNQDINCFAVFKNSLYNNLKLFAIMLIFAFVKVGFIPVCLSTAVKGFTTGFTSAALIRYYGMNGILMILSNVPAMIILVPAMIFFAGCCIKFSFMDKMRNTVTFFLLLSLFIVSLFLAASLADGYVNTALMKLVIQKMA